MASKHVAEIFFDESGHDGENLMAGSTPVLAHGSVHLDLAEASDLVEHLRRKTRAQSPELKIAAVIRNRGAIDDLFGEQGALVGHTQVYLVEKAEMAAGKMVDLLIEERAYAKGINLYDGTHRRMVRTLYEHGPKDLGDEGWRTLVSAFTSLMRETQRKGGGKETVDGFFEKVEEARSAAKSTKLKIVLNMLADTRKEAEEFQADVARGDLNKSLDPLQTSLMQLAYDWSKKLDRPIMVMHDAQKNLTERVMDAVKYTARTKPPAHFNLPDSRFPLVGIKHIDSKADPRIQLADIAAGFTRQVAESALRGNAEDEQLIQVQRLVHFNSIWGDAASWENIRPRDLFLI